VVSFGLNDRRKFPSIISGRTRCKVQHTLVALLLALEAESQVLLLLPVNLRALGVVINEVTTVSALILVVVGLGDGLVGEELVLSELED
jgi:hypothetical protein